MTFINNKEISFVVQGPIVGDKITYKTCSSIRKYFPNSKIILSSWAQSNTKYIDYDILVLSKDPGAEFNYYTDREIKNNINRMLISTINGLNKVNTKYAVKIRSDIFFESNKLLFLLKKIKKNSNDIFSKSKIIIPSNLTVNPSRVTKMALHPSDFFFAGYTKDLIDMFSIKLMRKDEMTWFLNNKMPPGSDYPTLIPRFSNEQFLFYSFLKKKIDFKFENAFQINDEIINIHNDVFQKIFLLYHSKKIGINCYKYPLSRFSSIKHAYTEYEFKNINSKKILLLDFERIFSLLIDMIKKFTKLLSPKFFLLIRSFIVKKFH